VRKDKSHTKAALLSLLVIGIIFSASFIFADEAGNNAAQKHVTGMTLKEKTGTGEFLKDDNGKIEGQGEPTFRVSLNDKFDAFFEIDSLQTNNVLDDQGDKNYRAIFGIHLSL
jgi:hypothetical protein